MLDYICGKILLMRHLFIISVLALAAFSCKTPQVITTTPVVVNPIAQLLDTSSVLEQSFTGLALYDMAKKEMFFERNAQKFFTPASNTKLYTYYACLKTLGDSIPALRYVVRGDSLIFWGTGDPTLFHPDFQTTRVLEFFKANSSKKLFFSHDNFTNDALGAGWQWDDYNGAYQPEINSLPMYGNIINVNIKDGKTSVSPPFFKDSLILTTKNNSEIIRNIDNNQFEITNAIRQRTTYNQNIPYKTSLLLTQKLLTDTLKKAVGLVKIPLPEKAETLYSMPIEPVYQQMLIDSDNMLAEQLLLLTGATVKNIVNSSFSINYAKETYMKDLPDVPKWEDGSGLTRYNLFTPRATIKLLQKIYTELPQEKLFSMLPTGGRGTLSSMFKSDKPFVFAKTGTLSGVYCLSGYLITKQNKLFLFSFMNNNFTKPTSSIRKEVERIITWVADNN
jgi:serine-type D-Ala-D-Ala carboxypeptidase/endopeptidase (penicillin-binding protein 4)